MAYVYHIELTSQCNLSCRYCTLTFSKRTEHGQMSEATFRKIVAHMQKLSPLNLMILHHFGEPLLHTELDDFVRIAAQADLNPGFSTNGELLTPERLEQLVDAGLKWMCVAFHTERGREAFEACLDTAKGLRMLYWGRELVHREEAWDPQAVVNYGIERQVLHSFAGAVEPVEAEAPGWAPRCDYLEKNFVCILHDGRVVPCGMDEHGQHVLGTVDDLDRIEQAPSYELCRSCEGFRFYESFRLGMREMLADGKKDLDKAGWHDSLPLDESRKPSRSQRKGAGDGAARPG